MFVVNLIVRLVVLAVGVMVLASVPPFTELPSPLHEVFGLVVVLFAVYRLLLLWRAKKDHDRNENNETSY